MTATTPAFAAGRLGEAHVGVPQRTRLDLGRPGFGKNRRPEIETRTETSSLSDCCGRRGAALTRTAVSAGQSPFPAGGGCGIRTREGVNPNPQRLAARAAAFAGGHRQRGHCKLEPPDGSANQTRSTGHRGGEAACNRPPDAERRAERLGRDLARHQALRAYLAALCPTARLDHNLHRPSAEDTTSPRPLHHAHSSGLTRGAKARASRGA